MATADGTSDTQRSLQISSKMTVGRASLLLAAMIALSRITGYGRQVLTSYLYGITDATDACNAAFNIPDTITIIIAGGALATGFVPVFTEYLAQGKEEAARRTFRAMFTLLGCAVGAITIVLFVMTYTSWGKLLAPQKISGENVDLYLRILRILLISQFFFIVGGLFSGTLNALRLFLYPALQPVMFNCGIIIFGIVLPRFTKMEIESQAWGALAGSIVGSLLIQMPAVVRNGLSLKPLWDLNDDGVRRVLRSLLPIVFGLASGQIIALNLSRFFALSLKAGDLTALDNANRLMQVPLAMLASGPAIALYPTISLLSTQGNRAEMRRLISGAFRRTLQLTVLATALLMALGYPIIHLLLEHGSFGKAQTKATAAILWYYSFCLIGLGAQQILARGFYALQDTATPVVIGVVTMVVFLGLAATTIASTAMGAMGLALAAAVAVSLLGLWMLASLSSSLEGWDEGASLQVAWRAILGGIAAYYAAWTIAHYAIPFIEAIGLDGKSTPGLLKLSARAAVAAAGALGGAAAYVVVTRILGISAVGGARTNSPSERGGVSTPLPHDRLRPRTVIEEGTAPSAKPNAGAVVSAIPVARTVAPVNFTAAAEKADPVSEPVTAVTVESVSVARPVESVPSAVEPTPLAIEPVPLTSEPVSPASELVKQSAEIAEPTMANPATDTNPEPPRDGSVAGTRAPANRAPRVEAATQQAPRRPSLGKVKQGADGASAVKWSLGVKKNFKWRWPRFKKRDVFEPYNPFADKDKTGDR